MVTAAGNVARAALQLISSGDWYQQLRMDVTDSCNGTFNLLLCLKLAVSPSALHHLADLKRCFRGFSDVALTGH